MSQAELRVLQVVKGIDIGGNSGGSEHFGIRLARQLRKNGVDVSLCAFYRFNTPVEAAWVRILNEEGIPCFFAAPARRLGLWAGIRAIARFAREHKIHLIHSHFQAGTIASMLARRLVGGMRVLRTAHTPLEFGSSLSGRFSRLLFVQWLYPLLLDEEVGVSPQLVEALDRRPLAKILQRKARCVFNGLDEPQPELLKPPSDAPFLLRQAGQAWIITSVGILNPIKRFDAVIQALPAVLRVIPQVHYVVVGSGPEEASLRAQAERSAANGHVWFLGQRADIPAILRHTDAFVLPSTVEAMSTVILEAVQNHTPVLASNIPGNAALIQDGVDGVLFPAGDADAIVRSIFDVYQSPQQAAERARHAAQKLHMYSLSESAGRYLALYHKLCQAARR